mmetsp:Transcript_5447/g.15594  ORF Transcript_5447/g.15594 Transcript_5447/m.15594 type:complete len:590 (-) Transcript_5447:196-1965(-)
MTKPAGFEEPKPDSRPDMRGVGSKGQRCGRSVSTGGTRRGSRSPTPPHQAEEDASALLARIQELRQDIRTRGTAGIYRGFADGKDRPAGEPQLDQLKAEMALKDNVIRQLQERLELFQGQEDVAETGGSGGASSARKSPDPSVSTLCQQLATRASQEFTLQREMNTAQERTTELQSSLAEMEACSKVLEQQLAESEVREASMQTQLESMRHKADVLEAQAGEIRNGMDSFRKLVEQKDQELAGVHCMLTELQVRMAKQPSSSRSSLEPSSRIENIATPCSSDALESSDALLQSAPSICCRTKARSASSAGLMSGSRSDVPHLQCAVAENPCGHDPILARPARPTCSSRAPLSARGARSEGTARPRSLSEWAQGGSVNVTSGSRTPVSAGLPFSDARASSRWRSCSEAEGAGEARACPGGASVVEPVLMQVECVSLTPNAPAGMAQVSPRRAASAPRFVPPVYAVRPPPAVAGVSIPSPLEPRPGVPSSESGSSAMSRSTTVSSSLKNPVVRVVPVSLVPSCSTAPRFPMGEGRITTPGAVTAVSSVPRPGGAPWQFSTSSARSSSAAASPQRRGGASVPGWVSTQRATH